MPPRKTRVELESVVDQCQRDNDVFAEVTQDVCAYRKHPWIVRGMTQRLPSTSQTLAPGSLGIIGPTVDMDLSAVPRCLTQGESVMRIMHQRLLGQVERSQQPLLFPGA